MQNYIKVGRLGRGSSSDVFLVKHKETEQLFAMKKVHLTTEDENLITQEVKVLSQLKHPNIIKYYESFIHQNYLCIIMEYAYHGDLQKRIREMKQQSETSQFSEIQMCNALLYIHNKKIMHRDLKAQNIFLNKNEEVIIGDFGICKVMTSTQDSSSTQVGTPYNFSPELVKGQSYNTQSDCWGLGCVLYELCTLLRPFEGENFVHVIGNILNYNPKRIPERYSDDLQFVISSLLEKNPQKRLNISQILQLPQVIDKQKEISQIQQFNPKILRSNFSLNLLQSEQPRLYKSNTSGQVILEDIQSNTGTFPQFAQIEANEEEVFQESESQEILQEQLEIEETFSHLPVKNAQQIKKSYQREIQINIPTPTEGKKTQLTQETQKQNQVSENQVPWSAPSAQPKIAPEEEPRATKTLEKQRNQSQCNENNQKLSGNCPTKITGQVKYFTFGESLLKKAPTNSNRPMLMQDFLKQKLGESKFQLLVDTIKEHQMDAITFLKQKPGLLASIVGQENIPIIDVGVHAGAFSFDYKPVIFPNTTSNGARQIQSVNQKNVFYSPDKKKKLE